MFETQKDAEKILLEKEATIIQYEKKIEEDRLKREAKFEAQRQEVIKLLNEREK